MTRISLPASTVSGIDLVDAPDILPIGSTVVSIEAVDQSGNRATAQITVTVIPVDVPKADVPVPPG